MFSKTITYNDFNGNKVTEDFWFHLTKAEIFELEASVKGGLKQWMQDIIDSESNQQVLTALKKMILASYGERTVDGRRFVKNEEIHGAFQATEAYSELLIGMFEDPDMGAEFFRNLIPNGDSTGGVQDNRTPAEKARARSEAAMRGHQAKRKPEPVKEPAFTKAEDPEEVESDVVDIAKAREASEKEARRRELQRQIDELD